MKKILLIISILLSFNLNAMENIFRQDDGLASVELLDFMNDPDYEIKDPYFNHEEKEKKKQEKLLKEERARQLIIGAKAREEEIIINKILGVIAIIILIFFLIFMLRYNPHKNK